MANLNNVSLRLNGFDIGLMKLNGSIVYKKKYFGPESFYIEYTVQQVPVALNAVDDAGYPVAMPKFDLGTTYESIEITLNSGAITTNAATLCENIAKVKLWYPMDTARIRFYHTSDSSDNYLESIKYCNTSQMNSMVGFAYNCPGLTSVDCSDWDTSNVTNMQSMFYYCTALTSLSCGKWDTSSVTDMSYMFNGCSALTSVGDLSNWNTSSVTNMSNMFVGCESLTSVGNLSKWYTSGVTNMYNMFYNCKQLTSLNLRGWKTNNVTNMSNMFNNCENLVELDIRNFDATNAGSVGTMFWDCNKLQTLRLDYCNYETINKIINSSLFPTGTINGVTRKLYCKQSNVYGLAAPSGWEFYYVN